MPLLWRHRLPLLLLVSFWLLALGLYVRWELANWYPTTGDEPHHLDIGRSLVHHGSLELTDYYEARASKQGKPGDIPAKGTYHLRADSEGLYSVRPIGTGLMAVPAIVFTDLSGYHNDESVVRVSFVLASGAVVIAAATLSRLYVQSTSGRVLAVVLSCFSLPVLMAANQIFPDMPAGIIALSILAYVAWRLEVTNAPLWADIAVMALVPTIPFLHYKLSPMSAILAAVLLFVVYHRGASGRHLVAMCILPAFAAAFFFAYNLSVDGDLMPTSPDTLVSDDLHSMVRWMFTFSLDRWHGFLLQNPAFFVGVLFFVPFLLRCPIVAVPALLCFLTAMGINSAHGAPGFSFAGRHAWTGAMLAVPAVIFGIGRIEAISPRVLYALSGILVCLQVVTLAPLFAGERVLYNQPPESWFDVYPSFYPQAANRFLPAIYNTGWWLSFALNWVFIVFAAALLAIGAVIYPRRREWTLPAAGSLLAVTLPVIVLVSLVATDPPRDARVWRGSEMHNHFGFTTNGTVEARVEEHRAGIWTFGPYIKVAPGSYRVSFAYTAHAPHEVKVGRWDVTGRGGRVRFASGDLYGSSGLSMVVTGTLTVKSRDDGENFEMRTYFEDVVDLRLNEILLEPAE